MSNLHDAIQEVEIEVLTELLSDGKYPNELDDDGNHPLDLTANQDIIDLLFMYGAIREPDCYYDMRCYVYYDEVIRFDEDFKNEIIEKLKISYGLDLKNAASQEIWKAEDGILFDLKIIGVKSITNGNIEHSKDNFNTYEINSLLERLGYEVSYEGTNNKLEGMNGVYFVEWLKAFLSVYIGSN